jgi:hypothetical protein
VFLAVSTVLAVCYLVVSLQPIWDVDIFWHVKAGEWIVANGKLPETDIFSAADPSRPWHTFQWLYEVLVYALDSAGGLTAVRVAHALVIVCAFQWFLWFFWTRRSPLHGLVAFGVVAVAFADRVRTRPDAFNLLFTGLLLPVLFAGRTRTRHVVGASALVAVWCNVHGGGALLAPVLLAARAGALWIDRFLRDAEPGRLRRSLTAAVPDLVLLAVPSVTMLVMPGFLPGVVQSFQMLEPSEKFIPEWMTTYEFLFKHAATPHEVLAALLPISGLLVLLAVAFVRSWRDGWTLRAFPMLAIALAMPTVFLSLEHVRFLWLGAVPWLTLLWLLDVPQRTRFARVARASALAVAALALVALNLYYHVHDHGYGPVPAVKSIADDVDPAEFPIGAGDFIEASGLQGGILNHAAWGGYLLYRCWPRCTVLTDGRGNFSDIETFSLMAMQLAGVRRDAINHAWRQVGFDIVVHPSPFPVMDYSRFDWVLVYRDQSSWVFVRNDRKNADNFDRVRSFYAAHGLDLPASVRTADVYEFERRISRFLGSARLSAGPERFRLDRLLAARNSRGDDPGPVIRLAALYYDVGLYREARQTASEALGAGKPRNAEASLLTLLSLVADGLPADGLAVCKAMQHAMSTLPGYAAQIRGDKRAMFELTCSHLVEYMLTVPHNHYKWKLDGGKWQDWKTAPQTAPPTGQGI